MGNDIYRCDCFPIIYKNGSSIWPVDYSDYAYDHLLTALLFEDTCQGIFAIAVPIFFAGIEMIFLLSSLDKFVHGGYVAVLIALAIIVIMYIWYKGSQITDGLVEHLPVKDYLSQLDHLRNDHSLPILQTNVVYLTKYMVDDEIDAPILYSILDRNRNVLMYIGLSTFLLQTNLSPNSMKLTHWELIMWCLSNCT